MSKVLSVLVCLVFVGCAEPASPPEVIAHGGPAAITTDQATYVSGQTVVASWTGLPTNANDWVAIAPAGSPATTVISWSYTAGATSGMHSFAAPAAAGTFVARAFLDDSYTQLAESATFSVTSSGISTDQSSYIVGQNIVVSWNGLPGNANDWIAIAPDGSDPTVATRWAYTGGAASGMVTFNNVPVGTYVGRAFLNNSYSLLAQSTAFTVTQPMTVTVTTDKPAYFFFEDVSVIVSWQNMPPGNKHWIALADQGAPLTSVAKWAYTNGQPSGSVALELGLARRTFVARAFLNDVFQLADESDPFKLQARVSTNKATYAGGENIVVSYGNLPGGPAGQNNGGTIELRDATSGTVVATQTTNTSPSSTTFQFGIAQAGTYVAEIVGQGTSAPFTVAGSPVSVTATPNPFPANTPTNVTITYVNLPGPTPRWVAVAPAGSPDTTVIQWVYISGDTGTTYFPVTLAPGNYVARAFVNDSYQKVAEGAFVAQ